MIYSRIKIKFFPVFVLYFAIEIVTSDLWVIVVFNYIFFPANMAYRARDCFCSLSKKFQIPC